VDNDDTSMSVVVGSRKSDFDGMSIPPNMDRSGANNEIDFSALQLSDEERHILGGKSGTVAEHIAMRTICRIASIADAPRLIPVTQAHIDGCTYIGPGGRRFAERLVEMGGKVKVPTTLNSVSADRRRWVAMGVSSDLAEPANAVGDAYLKLGCLESSFTCAPYLLPTKPSCGEHICWGESNAVVYSNSVIGARTEKVADYVDICSAIVGRVPLCGVHLDTNRKPGIIIDVEQFVNDYISLSSEDTDAFWPILGHVTGILSDGKVPIIFGLEKLEGDISQDDLKSLCAAFGTTGSSPLLHIAGITPEAKDVSSVNELAKSCTDQIEVTYEHVIRSYEMLDSGRTTSDDDGDDSSAIELVAFGNPHLSLDECCKLASLMTQAPEKDPKVKVMATLSRHVYDLAKQRGYVETMESFGVQFINDTCWCMLLDAPVIPPNPKAHVMTNSGKYAHYGPGLTNRGLRFGSMAQCINAATGNTRLTPPQWLAQKRGLVSLCASVMSRGKLR
jgi:predicted aconitase